jgi:selenocysteine lyase/cysteine desulfurase
MPLEAMGRLCKECGCELFVDAIQGLGIVDIDVARDGIDYLSVGSHKWLMGPEGIAALYVRDACAQRLRPHLAGWLSHHDALSFLFEGEGNLRYDRGFQATAELFEQGMPNTLGCIGLEASLGAITSLGATAIRAHVTAYLDILESVLVERGFKSLRARERHRQSGILSVAPPAGSDVITVHNRLQAAGISCSTPDGLLRFAPHWPNHQREVAAISAAV